MFGNLSKTIIKVPNHFNIHMETEPKPFSKISYEKLLNSHNNLKKLNYKPRYSKYFKVGDFTKNNLKLDLNYNNNFRKEISPHIKPRLSLSFEEFILGSIKPPTRNTTGTMEKIFFSSKFSEKNSKYDSKNSTNNNIIVIEKKIDGEKFNNNLNNNIDNLINKIHENTLNLNLFTKKRELTNLSRQKRMDILKKFINGDTVVDPPKIFKFPKMNIKIKSNERIYRDILDKKMTSLSMLSPKIKEQLKSKYRYFTPQKEYYKYNNSYFNNRKNPFMETVKYLEEIKNDQNNKINKHKIINKYNNLYNDIKK